MFREKMVWSLVLVAATVVLSVAALAGTASADLVQQDSSSFTYKYEMDSETGLTFVGSAGTHSASGGIETIATTVLAGGRLDQLDAERRHYHGHRHDGRGSRASHRR